MTLHQYNKTVHLLADHIFRFILKNLLNKPLAEDLTQDVFSTLWIHHKEIAFDKAKAYLFKTAFNLIIDYKRKEKTHQKFQNEQSFLANQEQYSQKITQDHFELQELLQQALDQLPAIQKAVITLRDLEGYSYKEIEEITGLNASQVKVYIYRGRLFLKHYLETIYEYQQKI